MKRQTLPTVLAVVALAAGFVSCGDDTVDQGDSPSTLPDVPTTDPGTTDPGTTDPGTTDPGTTDPTGTPGYDHPTGADEIVFEYSELGGFVPVGVAFQSTPSILISGDGRVFTPGPQVAIYPGPLLPNIQVQTITEEGIQQILAAAEKAGLFADVDYTADLNIADAPTATVRINVGGETWVHEAYALGFGPGGPGAEVTPERKALAGFLAALQSGRLVDPEHLGEYQIFAADEYLIQSIVVDDPSAYAGEDIEPTVVDWPAASTIRLADATACAAAPASEVGDVLAAANQLTFFEDEGVIYQVLARPLLPGGFCDGPTGG